MIIQCIYQRLDTIPMLIFKNTLALVVIFLAITSCLANPSSQTNASINNSNNDLNTELLRIKSDDLHAISSTIKFAIQHENDTISSLDPTIVTLIQHTYPDYRFYDYSCTEHYTKTGTDEYLIPLLSPAKQSIKYLLLIAAKNHSYKIKEFGNLKLTGASSGWQLTTCLNNSELLKQWKAKEYPEKIKWFSKPLKNGLGYFCVMRDHVELYYAAYICYQYDEKTKTFPILSINYLTDE